jgi:mannitol/fructose-specific phosphotransferase system IIA component (Ntr-type)
MKPVLNALIQLQEINLIRTEQKSHRKGAALEALDVSINHLVSNLAEPIQRLVSRLQMRDPVFIVPVAHSVCAGCGMRLPISLIQLVQRAQILQNCPTCLRILYFPQAPPNYVAKPARRSEPKKNGIARFTGESLMIPRMQATDRESAIRELAQRMQEEGFVDDAEKLTDAALKRESIVSTALDHGIAVPHVRGVEGGGLTLALGLSPKGIHFDDDDKSLSRIVVFIVIPTAASAFYLKLIAGIAETLISADARKALMAADSAEKLWKTLQKLTRKTIP